METIKKRKYFLRATKSLAVFRSKCVVVQACVNEFNVTRVGFTATKKIGCAVKRNRAKRRMREASRLLIDLALTNVDYIFIARKGVIDCPWPIVMNSVKSAFLFLNSHASIQKCQ